jgi:hypothetical protein
LDFLKDGFFFQFADVELESELAQRGKLFDGADLLKSEATNIEWQYLLTAHLDTQKKFFEEKIMEIEMRNEKKIKYLEEEFAELFAEKMSTGEKLAYIERQKQILEKKTKELEVKMKSNSEETLFLKEINNSMEENQALWKKKIQETEKRLEEVNLEHVKSKDEIIKDLEVRRL